MSMCINNKSLDEIKKEFDICLITHSDLDGIGCAALIKTILKDKKVFVRYASHYSKADEFIREALMEPHWKKILITDMSMPRDTARVCELDRDKNNICRVQVLDHHPGLEWLNEYEWATIMPEVHCGTSLVWEYLKENYSDIIDKHFSYALPTIERFVEAVKNYDLWHWKEKNDMLAKDLNDYLGIVGFQDFIDVIWTAISCNNIDILKERDRFVLTYKQKEIDNYIKGKLKVTEIREIKGYKVGCVLADRYMSELGNKMMEEFPEIDFSMMINVYKGSVSMRSLEEKGICLTDIAREWFGGGGHKLAAGGELDKEMMNQIKNMLFTVK